MRNLASVQRITAIHPIEGRDQIGLAEVLGWHVIVRYDQFKEGDLCVYFEIDSVLPENETFEFMRKHGFRVKTMKMAGQVSQGLCMPLSCFLINPDKVREGEDVTEILGVTKYEPADESEQSTESQTGKKRKKYPIRSFLYRHPITSKLAHAIWGNKINRGSFPDFVSKTDETRIQNIPWMLQKKDITFEAHEKVDGQSGTFALVRNNKLFGLVKDYDFIVCSRNLRLFHPDNSSYWAVAERYHLKDVLKDLLDQYQDAEWVCIQGECIAPNVQRNKYNVMKPDLYCFNLIVDGGHKVDSIAAAEMVKEYGLKWVPLINPAYRLPDTVEEVEAYAHGQSQIAPTLREGIVFRNYEHNLSWKCVDPLFLLKWKE